jgi:hypothetical protein
VKDSACHDQSQRRASRSYAARRSVRFEAVKSSAGPTNPGAAAGSAGGRVGSSTQSFHSPTCEKRWWQSGLCLTGFDWEYPKTRRTNGAALTADCLNAYQDNRRQKND